MFVRTKFHIPNVLNVQYTNRYYIKIIKKKKKKKMNPFVNRLLYVAADEWKTSNFYIKFINIICKKSTLDYAKQFDYESSLD